MVKELKGVKRVVVREQTAVALQGDGRWSSLILEGGAWKAADYVTPNPHILSSRPQRSGEPGPRGLALR